MPTYVPYSDDVEQVEPDEAETHRKINELMLRGQHNVREKVGQSVRVSHAKAHGFLKGMLVVDAGLPPELAQGLFAKPGQYPVVVRMAQVPGEVLDDRKVSTPRGFSVKVFDVPGPKLPGHESAATQDFVLDTGKTFIVPGAKAFLAAFKPNAMVAPKLPEGAKGLASTVAEATNSVLNAIGLNSGKLDFYGHPSYHPLSESYYSQAALRWGDYVAKLAVFPANPDLKALYEKKLELTDANALRTMTVEYFRRSGATFDVGVQLCTDLSRMPVEDATAEWSEKDSPYRRVGQIVLPAQDAYDPPREQYVDLKDVVLAGPLAGRPPAAGVADAGTSRRVSGVGRCPSAGERSADGGADERGSNSGLSQPRVAVRQRGRPPPRRPRTVAGCPGSGRPTGGTPSRGRRRRAA